MSGGGCRRFLSFANYLIHGGLEVPYKSNPPYVFLYKRVLKKCSKFTGEHLRKSVISVKLLSNFIEITLFLEDCPVNLLHVFITNPFYTLHVI